MCAGKNAQGGSCGAPARRAADPDGRHRCFRHSLAPDVISRRESLDASNRQEGREGKEREVEHRKAERSARAKGDGPKVPRRKGKRGPTPNATPVPKKGSGTAAAESRPKGGESAEQEGESKSRRDALSEHDLETADGRARYRAGVIALKLAEEIDARDADVLLKACVHQEKDKRPKRGNRAINFRWESIDCRQDAEDFQAAQEFMAEVQ